MYTSGNVDDKGQPLTVVYEQIKNGWNIAVTLSESGGFQQISFVNSIATTKVGFFWESANEV